MKLLRKILMRYRAHAALRDQVGDFLILIEYKIQGMEEDYAYNTDHLEHDDYYQTLLSKQRTLVMLLDATKPI
jgi:hypothetical protein